MYSRQPVSWRGSRSVNHLSVCLCMYNSDAQDMYGHRQMFLRWEYLKICYSFQATAAKTSKSFLSNYTLPSLDRRYWGVSSLKHQSWHAQLNWTAFGVSACVFPVEYGKWLLFILFIKKLFFLFFSIWKTWHCLWMLLLCKLLMNIPVIQTWWPEEYVPEECKWLYMSC